MGCFLRADMKGIWDLSFELKISRKWCTFLDEEGSTLCMCFTSWCLVWFCGEGYSSVMMWWCFREKSE